MAQTTADSERADAGRSRTATDGSREATDGRRASSVSALHRVAGNQAVQRHVDRPGQPGEPTGQSSGLDGAASRPEGTSTDAEGTSDSMQSSVSGTDASATSAEPFPHRVRIELAMGIDVPGRAVTGDETPARASVPALTDDTTTYFDDHSPDLEVAAHEAAHVAQHAERTRDAGLGAEGHAVAVAQRVQAGKSARDIVGPQGTTVPAAVRPYVEADGDTYTYRIAKDSRMAVRQDSQLHHFWATKAKVDESNRILDSKDSVIRLYTDTPKLKVPAKVAGEERVLQRVLPENVANTTSGENMNIWADCGRSARDVMGAGGGSGWGDMTAVYDTTGIETKPTLLPGEMKKEIFNKLFRTSGDRGLKQYQSLPEKYQAWIDRWLGLDEYATPETGEGYTISTGGAEHPKIRGDDDVDSYNFHWAGVVMTSDDDRTVLENYAVGDASVQNEDWDFQMYGPPSKPEQTFHHQHREMGLHGTAPTTMEVREDD
ncbi:MAG: hypothetical protein V5A28_07985 [Haloarculaceae archaeon]